MKSIIQKSVLLVAVVLIGITGTMGQRIIKGTVFMNGEPAAGINVEAHKGSSMLTSFDGKYQVEADAKTKWLKFTYIDDIKKLDISEKTGDKFDFYFDGIKPDESSDSGDGVSNKSFDELRKEKNIDFMQTWSLYDGFYSNKDYNSALPYWEKLYKQYPKSTPNIYIRGAIVEKELMGKASSVDEKIKHLNKMMEIYDNRIKNFGQKGYALGRKAASWFEFYLTSDDVSFEDTKAALKKGYDWLKESVDLQQEESEVPVIALLMNVTVQLFKFGELPKETVVTNYDLSTKLLNKILENGKVENKNDFDLTVSFIDDIFSKSGAADCDALIAIYEPQYNNNSTDIDFLKKMLQRLRKAKCDESELYNTATEKLYELDPSAEAAFNMARRFIKLEDFAKAKGYYKQAMEQETDNELLKTYYYEYGLFVYAKESALQEARSYARKALEIDPKYCEALILMGDIYVAASRNFGESDFEKATVFWLAVDYYHRAARANDECLADASKKASDFKAYFPGKEDVFFQGLSEGQSYKIGGWINENTTVRF